MLHPCDLGRHARASCCAACAWRLTVCASVVQSTYGTNVALTVPITQSRYSIYQHYYSILRENKEEAHGVNGADPELVHMDLLCFYAVIRTTKSRGDAWRQLT